VATPFYLKAPCDNCPFTKGTEASRNQATAHLAAMCVTHDIPFMCHKTMTTVELGEIGGHVVTEQYPTKVCAGWIEGRR
jgi:hypothetical protein